MENNTKTIKEFFIKYKVAIIAIIIAILIEIFICNYGFFRTLIIGNLNLEKDYKIEENSILIDDVGSRVTGIYIDYKNKLTDKVTYNVIYETETDSKVIELNPKVLLENDKQYINFDTHSNCKNIKIEFLTESKIDINKILLNHPNFNFNTLRLLIIFVILVLILKAKNGSLFEKEYSPDSLKQNGIFTLNLVILVVAIFSYIIYQFDFQTFFVDIDDVDKNNSVLLQAEAFANGQVELMEEPSKELLEMDNPYDWIKRDNEGVPYLYDVTYYNGHYYNYFGVAPVLTSVLPFRLITGRYTHSQVFTMIYIAIAVFALASLYKKLVKKYINKISLFGFYLGFYAILFGSNLFTLLRGLKYDIVVASGIAFLLLSLNLAISIYENPKFKIPKLILLGLTTGLMVLSKPTFIAYYLIVLFLLILTMKDKTWKQRIKDGLFIAVPLGALAIFQMALNYKRFDNIFEFGAKYQLTGLNMLYSMNFTFGRTYCGIIEYLLRMPVVKPLTFPFIFANTDTQLVAINELCYEARLVSILAIPVIYGYLLKKHVVKNKELKWFINIILISGFISLVFNTCCGGVCEVYCVDFKLLFVIGAMMILLKWLDNSGEEKESDNFKIINRVFMILCFSTIIIMLPLSLTTEANLLTNLTCDGTVFLKNLFEFWT